MKSSSDKSIYDDKHTNKDINLLKKSIDFHLWWQTNKQTNISRNKYAVDHIPLVPSGKYNMPLLLSDLHPFQQSKEGDPYPQELAASPLIFSPQTPNSGHLVSLNPARYGHTTLHPSRDASS